MVGADLQAGRLRSALADYTASESGLYVMYLPNRQLSPKVRAFIDFLLSRFGPTPYWDAS
jgi:DNA-binding transcriptional LysR family regulator